jgi:predicted RNA binding protein YcfA (HicA-like mRNA interferase family)
MRLPAVKPGDAIRSLERTGFFIHHQRGSHVYMRHPQKPGVQICVPYHAADLKRGSLHGILKDAGVSIQEFMDNL